MCSDCKEAVLKAMLNPDTHVHIIMPNVDDGGAVIYVNLKGSPPIDGYKGLLQLDIEMCQRSITFNEELLEEDKAEEWKNG